MIKAAAASTVVLLSLGARTALAQSGVYHLSNASTTLVYTVTQDTGGDIPLANKQFAWPDLPFQADSGTGPRGTQQGYNICNSTTLGQDSFCQTAWINSIDDFCLWGSPPIGGNLTTVGDDEEQLTAWCTKPTHGSRVIPPEALQGVQFIRAPGYIEIVGFIDQTAIGFTADDSGGEEDPHGADGRGNPLGGLVYSNAFGNSIEQVTQWNYFIGSGVFCFKACLPGNQADEILCNNVYDLVGCTYNMPANYGQINGTFESCLGDNQLPVGEYVQGGQTLTWTQPPESVAPNPPYTPAIPATSSCSTVTSSNIFADLASYYSASVSTSTPTSTPTGTTTSGSGAVGNAASKTANSSSTNSAVAASKLNIVGGGVAVFVAVVGALVGALVVL